jgi:chaperonin GroES
MKIIDNAVSTIKIRDEMNIKPLSNHILLEAAEEEKVTKSGIVIPDTADKERPTKGKVLAVGPGKRDDSGNLIPLNIKVGDSVLFRKYGLDDLELDGKKYLIGSEDDVLAIIEE